MSYDSITDSLMMPFTLSGGTKCVWYRRDCCNRRWYSGTAADSDRSSDRYHRLLPQASH